MENTISSSPQRVITTLKENSRYFFILKSKPKKILYGFCTKKLRWNFAKKYLSCAPWISRRRSLMVWYKIVWHDLINHVLNWRHNFTFSSFRGKHILQVARLQAVFFTDWWLMICSLIRATGACIWWIFMLGNLREFFFFLIWFLTTGQVWQVCQAIFREIKIRT